MPINDKSNWEKSSDRLVALFEKLAPQEPDVTVKKMFGWPCCFANGNLFTGLHKQSIMFRLSDADQAAFLKLDGTAEFEPMPGRKMKGYVVMADPLDRKRSVLEQWMQRSLAFTRSLPPKAKKAAPAKKAKKAKR
jgi:hypothetical protein